MKAAKDRREEFYDPARKDNILGRNGTRLELWKSTSKTQMSKASGARKICIKVGSDLVEARQQ